MPRKWKLKESRKQVKFKSKIGQKAALYNGYG